MRIALAPLALASLAGCVFVREHHRPAPPCPPPPVLWADHFGCSREEVASRGGARAAWKPAEAACPPDVRAGGVTRPEAERTRAAQDSLRRAGDEQPRRVDGDARSRAAPERAMAPDRARPEPARPEPRKRSASVPSGGAPPAGKKR